MLRWNRKNAGTPPDDPPDDPDNREDSGGALDGAAESAADQPPRASTRTLGELLLSEGKASAEAIRRALEIQTETGEFLGEILIREGAIDEKSLTSFLAKHCKIPHLSLLDYLIDEKIIGLLPADICLEHRVIPIDRLGRNLTVAMVNPLDLKALEVVRGHCPDLRIKPILCSANHFDVVARRVFQQQDGGAPVELSASSFGLSRLPTPAPAPQESPEPEPLESPAAADPPEAAEPSELETAAEEDIPFAVADDADDESERVIDAVFAQPDEEPAEPDEDAAAPEAPGPGRPPSILQEMAGVMMDSMRDTYEMLARRMDLFHDLAPEDVARIFARGITEEYADGEIIFEKGAPGDKLYVILSGTVSIEDGGREIARLARGGMFGEMALLSAEPRSASARAAAPCSLLALSKAVIWDVMPREVAIQMLINIIVTLSARLRQANEELAG